MSLSDLELLAEDGYEARKRRPEQVPTVPEPLQKAIFYFADIAHLSLLGRVACCSR